MPSTSTTHTRHEPVSDRPREVAHRRDRDPVLARDVEDRLALGAGDIDAVDLERVDGHAALPPLADRADARRAGPVDDVGRVLVAEVAERAEDRVRGALAEAAQARPADHVGEPLHRREIRLGRLAARDRVEQQPQLRRADPARDALAARLLAAEVHEVLRHVDHAARVVHDDHPARAHERADRRSATRSRPACRGTGRGCSRRPGRRSGPP